MSDNMLTGENFLDRYVEAKARGQAISHDEWVTMIDEVCLALQFQMKCLTDAQQERLTAFAWDLDVNLRTALWSRSMCRCSGTHMIDLAKQLHRCLGRAMITALPLDVIRRGESLAGKVPGKITHVAMRFNDRVWSLPEPARHHDVIKMIVLELGIDHVDCAEDDEGFLDTYGCYLDRRAALVRAREFGQLRQKTEPSDLLFSEDVW